MRCARSPSTPRGVFYRRRQGRHVCFLNQTLSRCTDLDRSCGLTPPCGPSSGQVFSLHSPTHFSLHPPPRSERSLSDRGENWAQREDQGPRKPLADVHSKSRASCWPVTLGFSRSAPRWCVGPGPSEPLGGAQFSIRTRTAAACGWLSSKPGLRRGQRAPCQGGGGSSLRIHAGGQEGRRRAGALGSAHRRQELAQVSALGRPAAALCSRGDKFEGSPSGGRF